VATSVHEQAAEFSNKNQRMRFLVLAAVSIHTADFWDGVLQFCKWVIDVSDEPAVSLRQTKRHIPKDEVLAIVRWTDHITLQSWRLLNSNLQLALPTSIFSPVVDMES